MIRAELQFKAAIATSNFSPKLRNPGHIYSLEWRNHSGVRVCGRGNVPWLTFIGRCTVNVFRKCLSHQTEGCFSRLICKLLLHRGNLHTSEEGGYF